MKAITQIRWKYHKLADASLEALYNSKNPNQDFKNFINFVIVCTVIIFGLPAMALVGITRLAKNQKTYKRLLATICIIDFVANFVLIASAGDFSFATANIFTFYIYMVLCTGFLNVLFEILYLLSGKFGTTTSKNELERLENERKTKEELQRKKAGKQEDRPIEPASQYITLGTILESDKFEKRHGIENYRNWLRFDEKQLNRHMFILGTTGAGKTETINRIIWEVLQNTNRDVFVIDGKGETKFAETVATMAYNLRGIKTPIFKLGHLESGAIYNGFSGSSDSIFNRIAYMVGVMEASTGEGKYYTEINKRLLQMVCVAGVDGHRLGITPPRSFEEILHRLDYEWLSQTYASNPLALKSVALAKDDRKIADLFNRLYNLSNSFGDSIHPNGFTLENTHCAVFSLKTNAAGIEARSLLDFLNSDVQDFISNRITRPAVMIIDEFGSFGNTSITNILSQSRSANLGVILATQTISSLGDSREIRSKIIENCNTHLMMKTIKPEELAEIAGTKLGIELGLQLDAGVETGLQTGRQQYQFKVNPQYARELPQGEGFFMNSGLVARVKIAQVKGIEIDKKSIAENVYSRQTGEFKRVDTIEPLATAQPAIKGEIVKDDTNSRAIQRLITMGNPTNAIENLMNQPEEVREAFILSLISQDKETQDKFADMVLSQSEQLQAQFIKELKRIEQMKATGGIELEEETTTLVHKVKRTIRLIDVKPDKKKSLTEIMEEMKRRGKS